MFNQAVLQQCLGVQLQVLPEQQYQCAWTELILDKDKIEVGQCKHIQGNIKLILNSLPKKWPVALNLLGKGILFKKTAIEEGNVDQLLQKAFPGANVKDFYIQAYAQINTVYFSVLRKDWLDELLNKCAEAGLQILQVSLGGFPLMNIIDQIEIDQDQLIFGGHEFKFGNQQVVESYAFNLGVASIESVKIKTGAVKEVYLLAYASGFQLLLYDKLHSVKALVQPVDEKFEYFKNSSALKRNGFILLMLFFVLLLLSFVLFSTFNQQNAVLAQQVGSKIGAIENSENLGIRIKEAEDKLKKLNWNGGYSYAFLIDEIGKDTPKHVKLTDIDFKPNPDGKFKQIKLVGVTSDLLSVNNWLFTLNEKTWVKAVKLLKYERIEESDDFRFNLLIHY